jgi:predicted GIY-YIG superfamily endonuclease
MSGRIGTVYLLHFDTPYAHAKHYTGWSDDLPTRLAEHEAGRGARLTEVAHQAGIHFLLARTWPGTTRAFERSLKNRGGAARHCPACGVVPRPHPPSPHWTAVLKNGVAVNLIAECRCCRERKPLFAFLGNTRRRVCLDCSQPQCAAGVSLMLAA